MQYKLYKNDSRDTQGIVEIVLGNRGIKDVGHYLCLDESVVLPYEYLDNMELAVEAFMRHFNNKSKIGILVDEDPDGFCSAAMMYMYIKDMDASYPVDYILHTRAKAHGLSDDVVIPDGVRLLIIPDAGTNDTNECKHLTEKNIDIIVLDHHEMEEENHYAIIVNNQMSERYTNKDLCGAGVVYQFLQALDNHNWNEFSSRYLDLFSIANISDVMDLRSFETRYLTDIGLLNINNKCLLSLIAAQEYSTKGKINIHNIQWFITPILNGMIRVGSLEEKELLFRAFIEQDEFFEYKKRATKDKPSEVIQESIYDRAARLCKNAKSRQDKQKEKSVAMIIEMAENVSQNDKAIMVDVSNVLDSGLTGVVAIKIAEYFNKPCILLKKHIDKETNTIVYGGSARNIDNSPIDSLKDIVNSTGVIKGKGHANAFGIADLPVDKMSEAMDAINDQLKAIVYDSTYKVDFILDVQDVSIQMILELNKFEDIICQGINPPMLAIENINLTRDCFEVFGKNEDTIGFHIDGIKYIQFKCKEGNSLYDFLQNAWDENDSITFNLVGKPSINEYDGVRTPQIIIEDIAVTVANCNEEDEW